jgi:hypothetical protein
MVHGHAMVTVQTVRVTLDLWWRRRSIALAPNNLARTKLKKILMRI